MKKTIAIYGGAFDPIHNGHQKIAQHVLINNWAECVWFIPCDVHAFGKQMTEFRHRYQMCKQVAKNCNKLAVSLMKEPNGGSTQLLMKELRNTYPEYNFKLIIGQDNAECIDRWINKEELLNTEEFIVFARNGCKQTQDWYTKKPHIFVKKELMNISSTEIREKIKKGLTARHLIDKEVMCYINVKGLYHG